MIALRTLLEAMAWGVVLGTVFVYALYALDVAGLGRMIAASDRPLLWLLMLWVPFSTLFSAVQFAWMVSQHQDED